MSGALRGELLAKSNYSWISLLSRHKKRKQTNTNKKKKIKTSEMKEEKINPPSTMSLPVSNVWTPRAVSVRVDPSLFVAVHVYVPVSSGLKS